MRLLRIVLIVLLCVLLNGSAALFATERAAAPGGESLLPVDYCPELPATCSDCYLITIPLPEGGTATQWDCLSLGNGSLGWQQCIPATSGGACVLLFDCTIFGPPDPSVTV